MTEFPYQLLVPQTRPIGSGARFDSEATSLVKQYVESDMDTDELERRLDDLIARLLAA